MGRRNNILSRNPRNMTCFYAPGIVNSPLSDINKKEYKMKKFLLCVLFATNCGLATAFTGLYQTIDDETKKPKSIVMVYDYAEKDGNKKLGGRIVALYGDDGKISETITKPVRVADKVKGSPKMVGLDVIWDMVQDKDEYKDGRILDPKSGKIYRSVMWKEKDEADKLRVRGKIGPFGRTQTWNVMTKKGLPAELQNINVSKWEPKIHD